MFQKDVFTDAQMFLLKKERRVFFFFFINVLVIRVMSPEEFATDPHTSSGTYEQVREYLINPSASSKMWGSKTVVSGPSASVASATVLGNFFLMDWWF